MEHNCLLCAFSSRGIRACPFNIPDNSGMLCLSANMLTIVILLRGKCGLSPCITRYLLAMAVADLLVLIFTVVLLEISATYFPHSLLKHTVVCSSTYILGFVTVDSSVWLTVCFTFDRFVAISCQKLRSRYCTARTAAVVIATASLLCVAENMPIYLAFEPRDVVDGVPRHCSLKPLFYSAPGWLAYSWTDTILTPFAPFLLILLFNALTIRYILVASKIRKNLRSSKTPDNQNDQEAQNRTKSIILLLAISGSFLLLWFVAAAYFICVKVSDAQYFRSDSSHPLAVMEKIGYMLQLLSPCTNTFIYAVAQTKYRTELKYILKYPFSLMIRLIKER